MNKILDCANIKVFDNVVSDSEFDDLHTWMNAIPYAWKYGQDEWNKSWSTTDGSILLGKKMLFSPTFSEGLDFPNEPLRPLLTKISESLTGFIGNEHISKIAITPYVWPPGVGLSWHTDSKYIGTFTYYVHKYWNANWSGEFLTVEADQFIEKPENLKWLVFDNQQVEDMIVNHGVGNFIYPKPNRLVVNRGGDKGILHKVNRSTQQAKDRLTLQGFLLS